MKDYSVKVPICGYIEVSIRAKNESEASRLGFTKVTNVIQDFSIAKQFVNDVCEFDISAYEKVVEGNFFHATLSEIKIEEV